AMARSQQHQVSMDMPSAEGAEGGPYKELGPPGALGLPGGEEGAGKSQEQGGGERIEEAVVFGVRTDQVELLAQMLRREEASNIALVAVHLKPDVQQSFLEALPSELRTAVLLKLGEVRFVEPDMILSLKDEIERRLQGAVGGTRKILEVMERSGPLERRRILHELEAKYPPMAQNVRSKILLPEDLVHLDDREFSLLVSSIGSEDWAAALWELPEEFKERVRGLLTEGAWKIVEQRMNVGRPPEARIDKAQQKILEIVHALVEEGKMNPPTPMGVGSLGVL
ncbi:MAG: hypothetical protein HY400_06625, partial [Elusimicrobia bacterium]|nr:hypothetical protein [Elusimicrobiota bacterium]